MISLTFRLTLREVYFNLGHLALLTALALTTVYLHALLAGITISVQWSSYGTFRHNDIAVSVVDDRPDYSNDDTISPWTQPFNERKVIRFFVSALHYNKITQLNCWESKAAVSHP